MDPSNGQHQEMATNSLENMLICTKTQQERKPRPQPEQALKCPRCDSTNTKFCYYNNYSLSQPRYFCKSCRRYWTKGGTLRNVPVGGGCRKNRRPSSSSSSKKTQDHHHNQLINPNTDPLTGFTSLGYDHCNDLNLAFARLQKQSSGQLGFDESDFSVLGNPNGIINHSSASTPFLDAIRSGFIDTQNSNFQNLYYGYGNGGINGGEVVDQNGGGVCVSGDMMLPNYDHHHHQHHHHHHHQHQDHINSSTTAITQAVTVTTMKQEFRNEREDNNNKVMFGFPWQISGNDVLGNSTWHGLINSPLM